MTRSIILLYAALSLLCACAKEAPHLPPSRMAPILVDLHVADAYSSMIRDSLHPNREKNYDSLARWTTQIFARHGVTMQAFNKSMDWYRDHPVELDSLYASVIPMLEKEKK
jgi:hypothetical protein